MFKFKYNLFLDYRNKNSLYIRIFIFSLIINILFYLGLVLKNRNMRKNNLILENRLDNLEILEGYDNEFILDKYNKLLYLEEEEHKLNAMIDDNNFKSIDYIDWIIKSLELNVYLDKIYLDELEINVSGYSTNPSDIYGYYRNLSSFDMAEEILIEKIYKTKTNHGYSFDIKILLR